MLKNKIKKLLDDFYYWYSFQKRRVPKDKLTKLNQLNDYYCVFVLSTGRCGTKLLTNILNKCNVLWIEHNPDPELGFQSYQVYNDSYSIDQLKSGFLHARLDIIKKCYDNSLTYLETNNRISLYAPAIASLFPKAKFIHLVRHPGSFVRSGIRRGYYSSMKPELSGHIEPRKSDPIYTDWCNMSQIQKISWQWNTLNLGIENFKDTISKERIITVKSEDMFNKTKVIFDIFSFLELNNPFDSIEKEKKLCKIIDKPVNYQKYGIFPKYNDWPDSDKTSMRNSVPLAEKYGYDL